MNIRIVCKESQSGLKPNEEDVVNIYYENNKDFQNIVYCYDFFNESISKQKYEYRTDTVFNQKPETCT